MLCRSVGLCVWGVVFVGGWCGFVVGVWGSW